MVLLIGLGLPLITICPFTCLLKQQVLNICWDPGTIVGKIILGDCGILPLLVDAKPMSVLFCQNNNRLTLVPYLRATKLILCLLQRKNTLLGQVQISLSISCYSYILVLSSLSTKIYYILTSTAVTPYYFFHKTSGQYQWYFQAQRECFEFQFC